MKRLRIKKGAEGFVPPQRCSILRTVGPATTYAVAAPNPAIPRMISINDCSIVLRSQYTVVPIKLEGNNTNFLPLKRGIRSFLDPTRCIE